jgi:hypothetical protein
MASDGPVANIKMTRHGYDDVIREFVTRVVDTQMECSWVVRRLGPTFIWGMSVDSALAVPLLF